jgi:hypothetical protein
MAGSFVDLGDGNGMATLEDYQARLASASFGSLGCGVATLLNPLTLIPGLDDRHQP